MLINLFLANIQKIVASFYEKSVVLRNLDNFIFVNIIGHLMHSYMRSIGRVITVLWVTIVGSTVRVAATLLLVPVYHMDGVYLGLVLSWIADGALSVLLYFILYHPWGKLQKVVDRVRNKQPSLSKK